MPVRFVFTGFIFACNIIPFRLFFHRNIVKQNIGFNNTQTRALDKKLGSTYLLTSDLYDTILYIAWDAVNYNALQTLTNAYTQDRDNR